MSWKFVLKQGSGVMEMAWSFWMGRLLLLGTDLQMALTVREFMI